MKNWYKIAKTLLAQDDILTESEKEYQRNNPDKVPSMYDYKKDWLERYAKHYLKNGTWLFYHATPKETFESNIANGSLRKGSLLTDTVENAVHYAGRDRDLEESDLVVLELRLQPKDFNTGIFPSTDQDFQLGSGKIRVA